MLKKKKNKKTEVPNYEPQKNFRQYICFRCGNLSELIEAKRIKNEYAYGGFYIEFLVPIGWSSREERNYCAFCTKSYDAWTKDR